MILVKILNMKDIDTGVELFICMMDEQWSLGTVAHAHKFENKEDATNAVNDLFTAYPFMENPYVFVALN